MNEEKKDIDLDSVVARALASVYNREKELRAMSELTPIPAFRQPGEAITFPPVDASAATWGILWVDASSFGFFIHEKETQLSRLRQSGSNTEKKTLSIEIPKNSIAGIHITTKKTKSRINQFLDRFSGKSDATIEVAWNTGEGLVSLRFSVYERDAHFIETLEMLH